MSLGDPCGIGPELAAKAWTSLRDQAGLAFCVVGDAALLAAQGVPVVRVANVSETTAHFADALPVRLQIQQHKVIWPPDERGV